MGGNQKTEPNKATAAAATFREQGERIVERAATAVAACWVHTLWGNGLIVRAKRALVDAFDFGGDMLPLFELLGFAKI